MRSYDFLSVYISHKSEEAQSLFASPTRLIIEISAIGLREKRGQHPLRALQIVPIELVIIR
jgi:hypothetical protein